MPAKAAVSKKSAPEHPPYKEMIKEAILALKDRNGTSRPALKKYIKANYKGVDTDSFDRLFNAALRKGHETNEFAFPKGTSGTVKLAKKEPAAKPTTTKKPVAAKPTAKATAKKTVTKKAVAKPKAAAATKKAAPKAAAKPKANAKKPRKEPAAAPAIVDKPATTLTKTKSGRVSKGTAAAKPAAKKAAPKKAAPKKKATPKKAAAS
jgi:histone H1/5